MTQETISKNSIVSAYMEYVLENEKAPTSVFKFVKSIEIDEAEFYKHFANFDALSSYIFEAFYDNTIAVLHKNEDFKNQDAKNQLLFFYYTFFEVLTANRSYILQVLDFKKPMSLIQLKSLKKAFAHFVTALEIEKINITQDNIAKIQDKSIEELAWSQLMITIKFWMHDTSAGFEKTDLFIEKSIHAGFDMMDLSPLKNIIDLGKFVLKEVKSKI